MSNHQRGQIHRIQPLKSQGYSIEQERNQLLEEIKKQRQLLNRIENQVEHSKRNLGKVLQSNQRNSKRILRCRAKMQQMLKYKNKPQYFLQVSGFMNQYVQQFILSHNYHMEQVQINDPDNMTYQQLLELGEKIGKVSKGLSKEQLLKLKKIKVGISITQHSCCICRTDYEKGQNVIELPCRHSYHQQCIFEWLKEQNTCPMCKKSVLE